MTQGFIAELPDNLRDPGFWGKVEYGEGGAEYLQQPIVLLLIGLTLPGATLTPDRDVKPCTTPADAATLTVAGSELYRMAMKALPLVQSGTARILLATATPASGATPATAKITLGGTWTAATNCQWSYWIAGDQITGGIASTDKVLDVAHAIAGAIGKHPELAVIVPPNGVVQNPGGTVDINLEAQTPGSRGNDYIITQDISALPAGMTSALSGGTVVGNGGVRFMNGSGTEDVTVLLKTLSSQQYDRIVFAQKDAKNLVLWRDFLDGQAAPTIEILQHSICCLSDPLAVPTALAIFSLDDQRDQILWMLDSETPPPEIAAVFGAIRSVAEYGNPNAAYDGTVLPGVKGQTDPGSIPAHPIREAALQAGITPITTTSTGQAAIVRSITTRTIDSQGQVDDRTIDTAWAVVPDRIFFEVRFYWTEVYRVAKPNVRDNRAKGEPPLAPSVATPDNWNKQLTNLLLTYQSQGWLTRVTQNPPISVYNARGGWIASRAILVVQPKQHAMEFVGAQVPYYLAS
jgi:phage tail sheath gpL-like